MMIQNSETPASADEIARREQDDYLDEALEETFPASDPIAPARVDRVPPLRSQQRRQEGD